MVTRDPVDILARAADLRRAGVPFALATVTVSRRPSSARAGAKAIVTRDGALFGWVGGACSQPSVVRHALEAIEQGEPRVIRLSPDGSGAREGVIDVPMACHSGGTLEIFIEPCVPAPMLVVAGDSPVSHALLALGRQLGYATVAVAAGDAEADEVSAGLDFAWLESDRHANTSVVIASMGLIDEEALLGVLKLKPSPAYVAVVGSRRRFASLADFLTASGVDRDAIDTVHSPAGIDIHAETAGEIALSIMAQIVDTRRRAEADKRRLAEPRGEVIDPVCGMSVDLASARHTLTHAGVTYGFCCSGCKREFERRVAGEVRGNGGVLGS